MPGSLPPRARTRYSRRPATSSSRRTRGAARPPTMRRSALDVSARSQFAASFFAFIADTLSRLPWPNLDAALCRQEDAPVAGRNTQRDGTANQPEFHLPTHYEPVWRVLQRPRLRPHVNRLLINSAVNKVPARPN